MGKNQEVARAGRSGYSVGSFAVALFWITSLEHHRHGAARVSNVDITASDGCRRHPLLVVLVIILNPPSVDKNDKENFYDFMMQERYRVSPTIQCPAPAA